MVGRRSTILSLDQRKAQEGRSTHRNGVRYTFWLIAILFVLVLAWFDGGEEALHPISQEIAIPELAE